MLQEKVYTFGKKVGEGECVRVRGIDAIQKENAQYIVSLPADFMYLQQCFVVVLCEYCVVAIILARWHTETKL